MCTPTPLIPTPGKNLTTTEKLITEQKYSENILLNITKIYMQYIEYFKNKNGSRFVNCFLLAL